ncbi:HK97 gp10 family phage protein [Streptomyces sp. NBC_01218]|uniref:HK97-gp10 family putative phage morphogenesis protein n=1 Tax=Streptomyces sp. NBC_01218 TaxID=2903780 RepID=UPI002E1441F0|nr:HK97 gp10 family phage protein [Streptomyces sp. NBC_01218]
MAARRRRRGGGGRGGTTRTGVTVSIEGLDALRERLAELTPAIRAAAFRALRESAEAVRDETRSAVRVDTHNLQTSVKARFENNRLRAEVGWWDADDRYAQYQEFGTRRTPARPALGPAIEAERTRIGDRIRAEVRRALG